ncbi:Uncharacterised protein [Bordetella pertussis]|nr:Uncharacterised protein [Bordetella pertussis]CFW44688.1 Uncharacterised protein [Bordetella pertussis]
MGGFSACRIEPSARCSNQSGWRCSQGWSGEHWIAKSSATSMPCAAAACTSRAKSARVPSCGWMASWPPSGEPIA